MTISYTRMRVAGLLLTAASSFMPLQSAMATVSYENLPTNTAIPPNVSWHNANGPVIADDFITTFTGSINHLTWWGSQATSNQFEIVLQSNAAGQPGITPVGNTFSGGLKQFVTATSFLYNIGSNIWQFDANVAPGWDVAGGTDYWLTVGNVNNGWEWAEALNGPTVGAELYNAHRSIGPGCGDGGPHCGPWTDVHTDFAFRINAVPEPATWAMTIGGLGLVGLQLRRRKASVSFA